jgi:5-methylcytosine-specific restriction endonuclease McrA
MKLIEKKLDLAWAKLVKLRAGYRCQVCGKTGRLDSHHIYSRAKKSVRWNPDNGLALCVGHHIGSGFSAHKTPLDFHRWLEEKKGKDWCDRLSYKSNQLSKLTPYEKQVMLDELNREINSYEQY